MVLYTENQLEALYKIYARHQNRNGLAFMKLEDFRAEVAEVGENIGEWIKENGYVMLISCTASSGNAPSSPLGHLILNSVFSVKSLDISSTVV